MFRRCGHPQWLGEKGFDLKLIVVADEREGLDLGDLSSREQLCVQVRELAGCGATAFEEELRRILRGSETVSKRSVLRDGPRAHAPHVFHYIFRLAAGDGQPHQMVAASLLNRKVDGAAVRRPPWRALTVVQDGADFAAVAAVGVHHPNVSVLHGRLAVGQSASSAAKDDTLALWRP